MGNKADENVPDQDLSNTTGSSFDDVKTETEESDTQDNSSFVYSDDTSTDTEQSSHNGSVINEQGEHNGPIVSDIDGLYTYGQLAKLLNKSAILNQYFPRLYSSCCRYNFRKC